MDPSPEITELLIQWCSGDRDALERLIPLVEQELHRRAHHYMYRENPGHILQTTALVNEAFLKLMDQRRVHWQNRAHFFAIAAKIMRRILLNYARDQKRQKRGGGAIQVSLSQADFISVERSEEFIALDEALTKLAEFDERKCAVVEMHFYGGLKSEEIAEVLQVSVATVGRDLDFARAWLRREMHNEA